MKILSITSLIFLFSCGGGTSVGPNQPALAGSQPDPISYKNVPENLTLFE